MVGMETADTAPRLTTVKSAPTCTCTSQAWMPVPEAALALGTSKEYLYAGLREGRFPGVKFGRSRGILRAVVQGFVTEIVELGLPISFEDYAASWFKQTAVAS